MGRLQRDVGVDCRGRFDDRGEYCVELLYVAGLVFVRKACRSRSGLCSYFIRIEDIRRRAQS